MQTYTQWDHLLYRLSLVLLKQQEEVLEEVLSEAEERLLE
jgi:hypothetical protein